MGLSEAELLIGKSVLDIGLGFLPGFNLGRDAYEAITGRDLIDGSELDTFSRALSVLGALTGGGTDLVESLSKGLFKIVKSLLPRGMGGGLEGAMHLARSKSKYELQKLKGAAKAEQKAVDSAAKSLEEFHQYLRNLSDGERVAKIRVKAASVAEENGWTKNRKLSAKNNRTVHTDGDGIHYSVDTLHGTLEKLNSRGKHLGEIYMDLSPVRNSKDRSRRHNIER